MRKLVIYSIALVMVFSLTACGGNKETLSRDIAEIEDGGASGTQSGQNDTGTQSGQGGTDATEIENQVDLSLDSVHYEKKGTVSVTLDFNKLNQAEAIIAIVNSDMPHNEAVPNYDNAEELRYLSDFSELPFFMSAPMDKDGLFDVRVYANSEDGEELASITIAVGNAEIPDGSHE